MAKHRHISAGPMPAPSSAPRRHRWPRWALLGLVALLLLVIVGKRVVAWQVQHITHPPRQPTGVLRDEAGQPFQHVRFPTADGLTLSGWYRPGHNGAAIILQHGYRSNSQQMLPAAQVLARHGYAVLCFDFRGHGDSGGDHVTFGLEEVRDTAAAVAWLDQQAGATPLRLGILGNSMGGATAILAAAEQPRLAAVATEGAFAALPDEIGVGIRLRTHLPARPLATLFLLEAAHETGYPLRAIAPVARIAAISPRAVFIMQGGQDARVAARQGEQLFAAAGAPKDYWCVPGAAHVALQRTVPAVYEQRLLAFFDRYLLPVTLPVPAAPPP